MLRMPQQDLEYVREIYKLNFKKGETARRTKCRLACLFTNLTITRYFLKRVLNCSRNVLIKEI